MKLYPMRRKLRRPSIPAIRGNPRARIFSSGQADVTVITLRASWLAVTKVGTQDGKLPFPATYGQMTNARFFKSETRPLALAEAEPATTEARSIDRRNGNSTGCVAVDSHFRVRDAPENSTGSLSHSAASTAEARAL
jgi:hypothetical protein